MLKVLKRKGNIVLLILTLANAYLLLRKFGVIHSVQTVKTENPITELHLSKPAKPSFHPEASKITPAPSTKKTDTPKPIPKTEAKTSAESKEPPSSSLGLVPLDKQPPVAPPAVQDTNLRLPHALIIGAVRCGTNPLLSFLSLHPKIAAVDGQINFFNQVENYKRGLQWYSEQMPNAAPHQILIERTPGYIYSAHAPKRVQAMNSSIKVIVLVRDPIKRAVSTYAQMVVRRKEQNETFPRFENIVVESATGLIDTDNQAIDSSVYHIHLERWMRIFPLEQIHLVDGEMFIRNPVSELRKIETFLGIEHHLSEDHMYFNSSSGYFCVKKEGIAKCYRHPNRWEQPKIDHRVLEKLRLFFQYHNQRLFKIVKQRFDWL